MKKFCTLSASIRPKLIATMCGIALILSGCASMDEGQCIASDWREVGHEDGRKGKSRSAVGDYAGDCSEYGVKVDTGAYRDGWDSGIKLYCTGNSGYRVGVKGSYYAQSCPEKLQNEFYVAYLIGAGVFGAQSRVNRLQNEVEELGDKASRNGLSDERRSQLRRDRKKKKKDLDAATMDLLAAQLRAHSNGY